MKCRDRGTRMKPCRIDEAGPTGTGDKHTCWTAFRTVLRHGEPRRATGAPWASIGVWAVPGGGGRRGSGPVRGVQAASRAGGGNPRAVNQPVAGPGRSALRLRESEPCGHHRGAWTATGRVLI